MTPVDQENIREFQELCFSLSFKHKPAQCLEYMVGNQQISIEK